MIGNVGVLVHPEYFRVLKVRESLYVIQIAFVVSVGRDNVNL